MEVALAGLIALFFAVAVYLLLSKSIIRMLLGVTVIGNAINLTIFTIGRLTPEIPPIIGPGQYVPLEGSANPLPQALILTAIVIGFGTTALLLVVAIKAYQATHTDHVQELIEKPDPVLPPVEYADPEQPSVSPEAGSPGDLAEDEDGSDERRASLKPSDVDWSPE